MRTVDPQHLLPAHALDPASLPGMVLEVPCHGVPLHATSVERLVAAVSAGGGAVTFQPALPTTSELGLPPYPVLARIYPEGADPSAPSARLSRLDVEEQIHYFADHYGSAISPRYARVVLSNTCNLKCVMCPYHGPEPSATHSTDFFKGRKQMPWDALQRIALDFGGVGAAIYIGSVEEPLLHPRLVDFVRLCRHHGVPSVHVTTNGLLLTEELARDLLTAGVTSVDVSIDAASPDTYKRVRGANLERVESNVAHLVRLRDRLGAPCSIRTSFVRNEGVPRAEEDAFRTRWASRVDSVIIVNLARYDGVNIRLPGAQGESSTLRQHIQRAYGRWACLFPFVEMALLPDGRVYYCIETLFRLGFDGEVESLGDHNLQTMRSIWSGAPYTRLRRDLIRDRLENRPACRGCDMWKSQAVHRTMQRGDPVLSTTVTEIHSRRPTR